MHKTIYLNRFPEGKNKAITFSYDDGVLQDRRLVELFNRYGLKATFHLNSGRTRNNISKNDVAELYEGHEVAVHTVSHPSLAFVPRSVVLNEVLEDRRFLEQRVGYPVTGMSYPNGSTSPEVLDVLRGCGITYARTTRSTRTFDFPEDFLMWHPTCHHREAREHLLAFKNFARKDRPALFYIWGHSYEFDRNELDNSWAVMEQFCQEAAGDPNVWYATNGELYRYRQALLHLVFRVDGTRIDNPSALDVWVTIDGEPARVPAGGFVTV